MFGITQQHGRNVIAIEARRERQDTAIGIQRVLFQKVIPHAAFAHDEPLTRHLAVLAQNPVTARGQGRFNPGKIRHQEAFEFVRPDAMQLRCTVVPILALQAANVGHGAVSGTTRGVETHIWSSVKHGHLGPCQTALTTRRRSTDPYGSRGE
jgi:hypothetical protein